MLCNVRGEGHMPCLINLEELNQYFDMVKSEEQYTVVGLKICGNE